ncbi:MAG TPA: tyrosine-type recombinase/integrase [Nitrososphaera sp.]|nr:tyrosine-type recombinase/integrase [Nitrososphaera sp.]
MKNTGVKKFTFHNYRNTALTRWARQGINVDVAMRASGHSSVQMHKRYGDLQREDIAKAFSVELEMATEIATEQRTANRKYFKSLLEKEGARWCRWSSKPVWGS